MPKGPLCRTNLARQSAGKPKTKKTKKQTQQARPKTKKQNFGFGFWFFRKPKTKKTKKSDPTRKTKNQNLGFGFWFFRKPKTKKTKKIRPKKENQKPKFWFFQKTKNPTKNMPLLVLVWPVGSVFFVFQKTKNQILVWFLVLGLIFLFFWLLVFGLVPGVCIFLLVGFWFFAGGVATYISSSSYKRTLQKPSLVDLSF